MFIVCVSVCVCFDNRKANTKMFHPALAFINDILITLSNTQ